jgi:endonuclease/exonuclease/phosphatase family metal-dependent hydrolase
MMHRSLCAGLALMLLASAPPAAAPVRSFSVATWNVRSGMGIRGFQTRTWSHDTLNCTDAKGPMNAWGKGLPQRELRAMAADPTIVALAVQEAWNCGAPDNLRRVLGFRATTRERNGVAVLTRYGFTGAEVAHRIGAPGGYDSWIVGGRVCLDAACDATLPVFSTHWGAKQGSEWPVQAQNVVAFLASQPEPHVFAGDLNVFRIDRWNPKVPCTNDDTRHRTSALEILRRAGYLDTWATTQKGEGWTGMTNRRGCGSPHGNLYKRIDYIFAKGLNVVATRQFARPKPGDDAPSDHVGLIAAFGTRHSAFR